MKTAEKTICPRCGSTFTCSRSPRCWCYEVDIPIDKLETLQVEYNGCLCPACLEEIKETLK